MPLSWLGKRMSDLELFGVDVAVAVEVEHLEGDLEVAPRGGQHRQQEDVVREGY